MHIGDQEQPKTFEPVFEVVWPASPMGIEPETLAPRLLTLNGATIGFIWDFMFRGDEIFPEIERELRVRFDDVTVVSWTEFGNTHGPDEAQVLGTLPAKLRRHDVDAVISAVGC